MYTREVRYLSCVHGMIEMKMNFVLALTTSVVRFGVCRHLWVTRRVNTSTALLCPSCDTLQKLRRPPPLRSGKPHSPGVAVLSCCVQVGKSGVYTTGLLPTTPPPPCILLIL